MSVTFMPPEDQVVFKKLKDSNNQTKSGLYLPDKRDEGACLFAEVVAVGPGPLLRDGSRGAMPLTLGDVIVVPRLCGSRFDIEGQELGCVRLADICTKVIYEQEQ